MFPAESCASSADSGSSVSLLSSKTSIYQDSLVPSREARHEISGQDLDDIIDQIQRLQNVLKDARLVDTAMTCTIDRQACLQSLEAIHDCLSLGIKSRDTIDSSQHQSSMLHFSTKEKFHLVLRSNSTELSSFSKSSSITPPQHDEVFVAPSKSRTSLTGDTIIA